MTGAQEPFTTCAVCSRPMFPENSTPDAPFFYSLTWGCWVCSEVCNEAVKALDGPMMAMVAVDVEEEAA